MNSVPIVVVLDDDPLMLKWMVAHLKALPVTVHSAADLEQARQVLAVNRVDVLVSDQVMPGGTGTKLFREMVQSHPDVVRILMTGHASVENSLEAINEGGVFKILQKPCSSMDFIKAVSEALSKRAAMSENAKIWEVVSKQAEILSQVIDRGPVSDDEYRKRLRPDQLADLTPREHDILREIVKGYRPKEIAAHLFISVHTVRNH